MAFIFIMLKLFDSHYMDESSYWWFPGNSRTAPTPGRPLSVLRRRRRGRSFEEGSSSASGDIGLFLSALPS